MKKLKFRVWDKLSKVFIYPDKGYQGHYVLSLDGKFTNLQNGSGGDECVVQQFTGLKDKNNKEIYEGDLVKLIYGENLIAEVYHQTNMGCLRLKCNDGQSYPFVVYRFDESNKPIGVVNVAEEVIGNIFEQ